MQSIIITCILSFVILLLFYPLNYLSQSSNEAHWYYNLKWICPWIASIIFLSIFDKNKVVQHILAVLYIPIFLFNFLKPIIKSINSSSFAYLFILASPFIAIIIMDKLFKVNINEHTTIFIFLTSVSIILTTYGDRIIAKQIDLQNNDNDKELIKNISIFLFGQGNIRILIYCIYFILLLFFNYTDLNSEPFFTDKKYSEAIMQAFSTYLAYDAILTNKGNSSGKEHNITFSDLKQSYLTWIKSKFQ